MNHLKISFVIVNYNGERFLRGCIDSVLRQTLKIDQIIMVDNCSKDDSVNLINKEYPFVEVFVMERNLGLTDAYNFGMEHARNEWVILANNDIVLEERCIETLSASVMNTHTIAVPLFVSIHDPNLKQSCPVRYFPSLRFPWTSLRLKYETDGVFETDIAGFGLLLANRTEVGTIDSRFPIYFDEDDFSLECKRKGIEIVLVSASKVYHYGSGTIGRISRKKIGLFLDGWVTFRIKWISPWLLLPSTVFALIMQLYQHLLTAGNLERFLVPYATSVTERKLTSRGSENDRT